MKQLFALVLCALLLVGCSLTATSVLTQPTERVPLPTQATFPSEQQETSPSQVVPLDWTEDALLSRLPELEGEWMTHPVTFSSSSLAFAPMSRQDVIDYAATLRSCGFTLEETEEDWVSIYADPEKDSYSFSACNGEGLYVVLSYKILDFDYKYGQPSFGSVSGDMATWGCRLSVADLNSRQDPTAAIQPAGTAWEEDPFRAMLPNPPTQYWTSAPQDGDGTSVELWGLSVVDMLHYAQQLCDAGFRYQRGLELSLGNSFSFAATNDRGYTVWMHCTGDSSPCVTLVLWGPGTSPEPVWNLAVDSEAVLDPSSYTLRWRVRRHSQVWDEYCLYGMDFHQAKDYLQAVQQNLKDNGFRMSATMQEELYMDGENQRMHKVVYGSKKTEDGDFAVYLLFVYDGEDPQCPFRVYSI